MSAYRTLPQSAAIARFRTSWESRLTAAGCPYNIANIDFQLQTRRRRQLQDSLQPPSEPTLVFAVIGTQGTLLSPVNEPEDIAAFVADFNAGLLEEGVTDSVATGVRALVIERQAAELVGDPHLRNWRGEHFEYMGQCDLRLAHVPSFDGTNNLTVHARTTVRYDYSYIETASIQIGNDTLEVSGWGDYAINGVEGALKNQESKDTLRTRDSVPTLAGYPVYWTPSSKKKHVFDIVLGESENIAISSMKDIVGIRFQNASPEHFGNVSGMLGDFYGSMLARDGITSLHDDIDALGQEWQVRDTEPMLFRVSRAPQYPTKCILPDVAAKEARRLEEGISEEEAEAACTHLKGDPHSFSNCVYDVTATNDVDMAQTYN